MTETVPAVSRDTVTATAAPDSNGHPRRWWILVTDSFTWGFYAVALASLLAVVPSLFVGRRLGEHAGFEDMSRAERAEAGTTVGRGA